MIYLGDNGQTSTATDLSQPWLLPYQQRHPTTNGLWIRGDHSNDFMIANHQQYKGVTQIYGPDGGVYLSDWTDTECHKRVHRTSGRIYK